MFLHSAFEFGFYNEEENIIFNFQSILKENSCKTDELILGSLVSGNPEFVFINGYAVRQPTGRDYPTIMFS